ncbi:hypothetical protein JW877_10035 [bacterium]|nr:hypothetical protein [bacterium]
MQYYKKSFYILLLIFATGWAAGNAIHPHKEIMPVNNKETMFTNPTESCVEPLTLYDIIKYDFNIEFLIPSEEIQAELKISLGTLAELDTIKLDLVDMVVDSIKMEDSDLSFLHTGEVLYIFLPGSIPELTYLELSVWYHGTPSDGYNRYRNMYMDYVFTTLFWASTARYFFPCVDHPGDRALYEAIATVPSDYTVASNGKLISDSIDVEIDKRIFHWQENHPICTYNICFSISQYHLLVDTLDTLPIYYYVFPDNAANALYDLGRTPELIEFFSSLFGPYPFDKYGINIAPGVGGGMEHQTMVSLDQYLIDGHRTYEYLFGHELSHQWFGDAIGLEDWRDFWLNEGFAVYSEVLMEEYFNGWDDALTYIQRLRWDYRDGEVSEGRFPIYDPEVYLGVTIYRKAPCVMHMLRFVMGDSCFFTTLKEYAIRFKYHTVTTPDFQEICEEFYGSELAWFFDKWIYDKGFPEFDYTFRVQPSAIPETNHLLIITAQVQYDAPLFTLPIEILIELTDSIFYDTLWIEDSVDTNIIPIPFDQEVTNLEIDPNSWLLISSRFVSAIDDVSPLNCHYQLFIFPNPFNSATSIIFYNQKPDRYSVEINNLIGQRITNLFDGFLMPGEHRFTWDFSYNNRTPLPPGQYYCTVRRGGEIFLKKKLILLK